MNFLHNCWKKKAFKQYQKELNLLQRMVALFPRRGNHLLINCLALLSGAFDFGVQSVNARGIHTAGYNEGYKDALRQAQEEDEQEEEEEEEEEEQEDQEEEEQDNVVGEQKEEQGNASAFNVSRRIDRRGFNRPSHAQTARPQSSTSSFAPSSVRQANPVKLPRLDNSNIGRAVLSRTSLAPAPTTATGPSPPLRRMMGMKSGSVAKAPQRFAHHQEAASSEEK